MIRAKKGVFWLVGEELLTFVYNEDAVYGIAKSGNTFNHQLLWDHVKPRKCNKPYDYHPRGRVKLSNKGKPIIYMNRNIGNEYLPIIMERFDISEQPAVHYDGSEHYKCHLDQTGGW